MCCPPGMTIYTHTCRGNFRSGWITSGAYDFIAEPYFGELAVDGFFLEYNDERSGSFAPLRDGGARNCDQQTRATREQG